MRHRVSGRRLGRGPSHQKAMFRSLASSMIIHEHLETTDARAKELRGVVDRLVTLGKKGTLHARRQAFKYLNDHQLVQKLFDEIAPRFSERPGGYTRLIKSRIRFVDQAPMTFVRFSSADLESSSVKEESTESVQKPTVEAQVKAAVEEELESVSAEAGIEPELVVGEEPADAVEAEAAEEVEATTITEGSESEEKAEK
ncbi:MAG: 50S ribosomal protein L17 [Deltaproteobacteria bacterium]|nr:50S ribosomal protein L17 [Candidatus Tharpella sp.]